MRTGKTSRSSGVRPATSVRRASSVSSLGHGSAIQAKDGEPARIRILDYLGGGKLVVDLKGQRVVANTALILEKNQEIDVIVKNVGSKVVLQLASGSGQDISLEPSPGMKLPLGDIIHNLIVSLEGAATELPTLDDTLKELIQSVKELVQGVPVDVTKADVPKQIQDAINALGHDYERKLARAFASGRFSTEEMGLKLKAKLMQLRSILSEGTLQTRLLEAVENMLDNLEYQQLSSMPQTDKSQHFCLQIPIIMQNEVVTAEVEFFRPKANGEEEDDDFSMALSFDLQKLGHMEFVMSVMDKRINCQIKADEYETYILAREQANALESRLTALGYKISGIHCALENPENQGMQNQMDMDDLDITI